MEKTRSIIYALFLVWCGLVGWMATEEFLDYRDRVDALEQRLEEAPGRLVIPLNPFGGEDDS